MLVGETIYTSLDRKSDSPDKVKLADATENGFQSVLNWDKKWLGNFNAS